MNKRLWKELGIARGAFRLTVMIQIAAAIFLMFQVWGFSQIINRAFLHGVNIDVLGGWFSSMP